MKVVHVEGYNFTISGYLLAKDLLLGDSMESSYGSATVSF